MKKSSIVLLMLTGVVLSCNDEDLKVSQSENNKGEYTFNISVSSIQGDTKAVKTGWEENDIISLWFDGATSDPQVILTYANGEWVSARNDASLSLGTACKLTALYESGNMIVSSTGKEYQMNGTEVEATIDGWIFNTPYQIVVQGIETGFSGYSLYCEDLSAGSGIELESSEGETEVKMKFDRFGRRAGGTENADGAAFYFTKSKTESEKTFVFYLTHNGARYSYATKATTISGSRANKKLPAFSVDANGDPTEGSKWTRVCDEYVDLGLSVKWATYNVGANSPEEYGDYFAWGETEPKENYNWSTYKYCNGSSSTLTKYCNASSYGYNGYTDSKTVLALEDDAAHVNWGDDWRMPTSAERDELLNTGNCTWTWYAKGNSEFNGIAGYKVQSKMSGYTDRWIFLPAAGYCKGTNLSASSNYYGYYWFSTFDNSECNKAYCVGFYSKYSIPSNYDRCYGLSVRPVCE